MKVAAQNVFLTHTSVELASAYWTMEEIRHCVIHSGIDIDLLVADNPVPIADREALVLTVGHTYSHKNYEAMIDAMAAYRDRYGEGLRLKLIGAPANPQYFAALKKRVSDQGLDDWVDMPGGASSEEVAALMARARVYLVTSKLETFGLTMFEAMGQGLPVVASDATCHPEVCGDAAHYCDPDDPIDIAEKVHQVVNDAALSADLRGKGFEWLKSFGWERSARSYLAELEAAARKLS
jgi:glycosyltransferase involved in cell wall biosynthesis